MAKAQVPVAEARSNLSEIINRVTYGQQQLVTITRRGKIVAAVISAEDMLFLEEAKQRYISHQLLTLDNAVKRLVKDKRSPDIRVLGINALGPLHQGRETLINAITKGGSVKLLLLNPLECAFDKRAEKEGDTSGRLEAELYASLHIAMDIMSRTGKGGLAIRLYNKAPDRSLIMANCDDEDGVVMENPYPTRKGTRGLTGKMYVWRKDMVGQNYYDENKEYFDAIWKEGRAISLLPATLCRIKDAVPGISTETKTSTGIWPFTMNNE